MKKLIITWEKDGGISIECKGGSISVLDCIDFLSRFMADIIVKGKKRECMGVDDTEDFFRRVIWKAQMIVKKREGEYGREPE